MEKKEYDVVCPRCGVDHTTEYEWIGKKKKWLCRDCKFDDFMESIFKFGAD